MATMEHRRFTPSVLLAGAVWLISFWVFSPAATLADEPVAAADPAAIEFFETKIRPLLANQCWECHGPGKQESSLRLDSREGIARGGDSGAAAVPGDPRTSRLIEAVAYTGDLQMPPAGKLTDAEIADLTAWVAMGMPWPADAAQHVETLDERTQRFRQDHWSLRPVKMPAPPPVADGEWPLTGVDHFVLSHLEQAKLRPSAPADRRTLLRRVTVDLTGLPPTYEDVVAFENDRSPQAYEDAVDRLLESPLYGQRWARHWLDVARYADTKGYVFTQDPKYAFSYTYRDYVVRAFNDDLPYDQFLIEQLAADLLPLGDDKRPLAGLGFLTLGRRFMFNPHDIIDDRIDVTTRGLMGLTVGCARCHDHKYDPIPQADYYSLYGVFASTHEPEELPLVGMPEETAAYQAFQAELGKRQAALDEFLNTEHPRLLDELRTSAGAYLAEALKPAVVVDKDDAMLSFSPGEVRPAVVERWRRFLKEKTNAAHPVFGLWHAFAALPGEQFADAARDLSSKLAAAAAGKGEVAGTTLPVANANPLVRQALTDRPPQSPADLAARYGELLVNSYRAWQSLPPGPDGQQPAALPDAAAEELRQVLFGEGTPTAMTRDEISGLLDRQTQAKYGQLARVIEELQSQSPESPPRAMALADNPTPHQPHVFLRGNPGRPGDEVPRRFLGVLSSQQRANFGPGSGRLEMARAIASADNPLTARVMVNRVWMHHFGASLVPTPGDFGARGEPPTNPELLDYLAARFVATGWSVKQLHREIVLSRTYQQASLPREDAMAVDPENRLWWRTLPRRLEWEALRDSLLAVSGTLDLSLGGRPVDLFAEPFTGRRTLYGFLDRQDLPGLLRIFDFANPDVSTPQRSVTTVPQQALFLMNSQFVIAQAKQLAARTTSSAGDVRPRVTALYRLALARDPQENEFAAAEQFLTAAAADATPELAPWEQFAQVLLCSNEFAFVD
ncbi:MAG: PSD1 and planctomycete cytochrome C domain-containing protein [Pirellulales bacterium]|nr:PSD1 and planctomycete cytochrome C domain-containing protein [Pirellulales bacterium]